MVSLEYLLIDIFVLNVEVTVLALKGKEQGANYILSLEIPSLGNDVIEDPVKGSIPRRPI